MTKSKGVGRGGRREGSGRPRFAKTGKTSHFSTRLTPKTRDLLEAEATRRGKSLSEVAEDLLQLALEEMAAIRKPGPLRHFFFLVEMLSLRIPVSLHADDPKYSWQSNPYAFAAFRAGVLTLLDLLRPPGKIVTPPAEVLTMADINDGKPRQYKFQENPEELGRFSARDIIWMARSHNSVEETDEKDSSDFRSYLRGNFARVHYGFADAWAGLKLATWLRNKK